MDSLRNFVIHCEKQIWFPIDWVSKRKYCKCMIATNLATLIYGAMPGNVFGVHNLSLHWSVHLK
jgi:hypothetical protein